MNHNNRKQHLVSILMAIYNPNYDWLKEQLISLDKQTYDNLELIIYDDCPKNPVDEKFIEKYIKNFHYKLIRGENNLGSNMAFEKLTESGRGDYFAYCDQDDVWEFNKIELLMNTIQKEKSILAYSDMSVIDENGLKIYETLLMAKPRIKYIYGNNIFHKLFFKNCISGCCMLIESEIAKSAIPFSKYFIHDQWLCIVASLKGKISFIDSPLVKYRIHGNNQTGSLKGINNKEDYYNRRVLSLRNKLEEVKFIIDDINLDSIDELQMEKIIEFCEARLEKDIFRIFKNRNLCRKEAYFEIAIKYIPNFLSAIIVKKLK